VRERPAATVRAAASQDPRTAASRVSPDGGRSGPREAREPLLWEELLSMTLSEAPAGLQPVAVVEDRSS
jgi:hypothetical protein